MKARVKHNNEIIDVLQVGTKTHLYDLNNVEFIDAPEDYWTRLEHQATIAAMQGLMTILPNIGGLKGRTPKDEIVDIATSTSHAIVQKLKEKEERK